MAIYGIGGKPGGGKTFFVCHHMTRKYFEWDKIHCEWVRRFPIEIITNVDELRLDHFPLDEMIYKSGPGGKDGTLETFFNVDYQRKLLGRFSRIVYIIDEAGKYFPSTYKEQDVMYFFQYHRHLGIDIYLVSAALEGIARGLLGLMEYKLIAKERSKRVVNEFRFFKYVGVDKVGTVILRPDNRIFSLYKSMVKDEHEKIPAVTRRMALLVLLFVVAALLIFKYAMSKWDRGGVGKGPPQAQASPVDSHLKSKVVQEKKPENTGRGVPLVEQGLRGETAKDENRRVVKGINGISLIDLRENYVKVYMCRAVDGSTVIYSNDGVYLPDEVPYMLAAGVKVGTEFWVPRLAPMVRSFPVEATNGQEGRGETYGGSKEAGARSSGNQGAVAGRSGRFKGYDVSYVNHSEKESRK